MSSPGSLRETYTPSTDSWSFSASTSTASNATSGSRSAGAWSRPSKVTPVFELSPDPSPYREYGSVMLGDPEGRAWSKFVSDGLAMVVMSYAGTAVVMPFEVAKVLLQVQWIPKEDLEEELDPPAIPEVVIENDEDILSDTSSSSYFRDPNMFDGARADTLARARVSEEPVRLGESVMTESDLRPSYIIPAGPSDGVWGMMRRVAGWKSEGWLSLWKGQLTATIVDVLASTLQPIILAVIQSVQTLPDPIPPPHSFGTLILPVLSHTITAHILSPLDLLRTRLICQPAGSSPFSLPVSLFPLTPLAHLVRREGGLYATYTHPHLLIPSLLDNTIRPLLSLSAPIVIHHYTGLDSESSPILFGVAELTWSIASLIITLPIETVRRRLQLQSRAVGLSHTYTDGWRTSACVETRPLPYVGVVDCFYRILTEERSLPTRRRKRRRSSVNRPIEIKDNPKRKWSLWRDTGIGQLYRGFNIAFSANVLVFILGAVAGERSGSDGMWAEV